MTTYYIYVDWTTDENRQAYYVGKGTGDRVEESYRSIEHAAHAQKRGRERVIVFSSQDEQATFDKEKELTLALRTNEFGFNKVVGNNGARQQYMRRRNIHVKLDDDVHKALKVLAAEKNTTMQEILEQHAEGLVRARSRAMAPAFERPKSPPQR